MMVIRLICSGICAASIFVFMLQSTKRVCVDEVDLN